MDAGIAVRARLLDQHGEPVEGTVRFLSISGVDLPDSIRLRQIVARADADGRLQFNSPETHTGTLTVEVRPGEPLTITVPVTVKSKSRS